MSIEPYSPEADALLAAKRAERALDYRTSAGAHLEALGEAIHAMGTAMLEDDDVAGVWASSAVADLLPRLPENIRHVFLDAASDESARSARADDAYEQALAP